MRSGFLDIVDPLAIRYGNARHIFSGKDLTWFHSDLVLAECLVRPIRSASLQDEVRVRQLLLTIERIEMPTSVFESVTRIRATYNLKMPDAIHIAAALAGNCDEFWSNDYVYQRVGHLINLRSF